MRHIKYIRIKFQYKKSKKIFFLCTILHHMKILLKSLPLENAIHHCFSGIFFLCMNTNREAKNKRYKKKLVNIVKVVRVLTKKKWQTKTKSIGNRFYVRYEIQIIIIKHQLVFKYSFITMKYQNQITTLYWKFIQVYASYVLFKNFFY